jgi:hypothetical protein
LREPGKAGVPNTERTIWSDETQPSDARFAWDSQAQSQATDTSLLTSLTTLIRGLSPHETCIHPLGLLSSCGPFRLSLRSLCGPACLEQPGTDENSRPRTPAFSRLSPEIATRYKDLNLRLFIGETGFEPATARPPAGCATRLRHSPWPYKRATGIEPALEAWKASVQPQHFARSPRSMLPALMALTRPG